MCFLFEIYNRLCYNKNMKKSIVNGIQLCTERKPFVYFSAGRILLVLLLCVLLTGCGRKSTTDYFDAGSYFLSGLTLDGEELRVPEVFPSGGSLRLRSDGTAALNLGENTCEAQWLEADDSFRLTFGGMTGNGTRRNGTVILQFDNDEMEYRFSETTEPILSEANIGTEADSGRDDRIDGVWTGRMWYEEPQGEWADYEFRSLAMSGRVTASVSEEAKNIRELTLYSQSYSDTAPILYAKFTDEDGLLHCLEGYFMSYPIADWGMEMTLNREPRNNLRDSMIIRKPGDYGHVFTQETDPDENELIDIIRLSGNCRDKDGAFDYIIELAKQEGE